MPRPSSPLRAHIERLEDRTVPAVTIKTVTNDFGDIEQQLFQDGFHLGTVAHEFDLLTGAKVASFQPHPDLNEPRGFGATYRFGPYLAGGEAESDAPVVTPNNPGNTFTVQVGGSVGGSAFVGTWTGSYTIVFDPVNQTVTASGTTSVSLAAPLQSFGTDLYVGEIAASYLDTVPVFPTGSMWQDTGNINRVDVTYAAGTSPVDVSWRPTQGDLFPAQTSDVITLNAVGDRYNVDYKLFGLIPIEPFDGPNVTVTIAARNAGDRLTAALNYEEAFSQVATQIIPVENTAASHAVRFANNNSRNMTFDVTMTSTPTNPTRPRAGLIASGAPGVIPKIYNLTPEATAFLGETDVAFQSATPIPGDARVAVGDVNGDTIPDTIFVTGPGVPIRVAVISGGDNSTFLVQPFDPFGGNFDGSGFVAAGDIDNDGRDEFVVTPDRGGGPRVSIYSLIPNGNVVRRANFFGIDDANFRGGARVALGDINGDGRDDLAIGAGFEGGPRVALFDGSSVTTTVPRRMTGDFFGFPGPDAQTLRNGAYVALGDTNGDGFADLMLGGGPGGAARVLVLSGKQLIAGGAGAAHANPIANFFVGSVGNTTGGVRVAAKDADNDGKADIVTASGENQPSLIRVYFGSSLAKPGSTGEPIGYQDLNPFSLTLPGGVFVG